MAQGHNELTAYTDLLRAFKAAVGEKRKPVGWGVERLGETLTPILDIYSRPEWSALFGEVLWWDTFFVAALAANFSGVQINNVSSNSLLTIDGWTVSGAATAGSAPSQTYGVVTTTQVGDARDRRFGSSQTAAGVQLRGYQIAVSLLTSSYRVASDVNYNVPIVLTPGSNATFEGSALNAAVALSAFGRIRQLLPGEIEVTRG